ncbi:Aste57867_22573 [Aphanomyces stellatus]|uniref:Aste57867_22573 protein n=1 Tax=Aphanomyces stellatus TaxID=120398 RepID=A0A485LLA2_9STRA|nr:hypothetical protein As57867_022503 [Aphanomyces stellatus]VFT99231.1 Aste57867_22573 [Aphanomyces stellatus]
MLSIRRAVQRAARHPLVGGGGGGGRIACRPMVHPAFSNMHHVSARWIHSSMHDDVGQGYVGQYSETTGEWEPDRSHMEEIVRKGEFMDQDVTLQTLIRYDIDEARRLFRKVLQTYYHNDMGMWNKWAVMEWRDGKVDLARKIFVKASKIRFHPILYLSWATMERELQNYMEARRLYKLILATEGNESSLAVMAGTGLAMIEDKCGNADRARRMFLQYKKRFPHDLHLAEAHALFEGRHGNLKLSRQLFDAITKFPDCTQQVYHAYAHLEYSSGNWEYALAIVHRGLALGTKSGELYFLRALALWKLGEVDNAREVFDYQTKMSVPNPRNFNAYALFEIDQGNLNKARLIFEDILRKMPTSVSNITSLAELHVQLHGTEEGVTRGRNVFENGAAISGDNMELLHNWGVFEEKHGSVDRAKKLFEQATEKAPWVSTYWMSLARVESLRGDIQASRVVLDKATMKCTNQLPLLVSLAQLELKNRNFKEAREACMAALKIDKKRGDLWNLRALIELPHNADRAIGVIENALKTIPPHDIMSWSVLLCTYARSHSLVGDLENAAKSYNESIRLDPKNYHTHMYLAEFLEKIGRVDEAKEEYEVAGALCPRHKRRSVQERLARLAQSSV